MEYQTMPSADMLVANGTPGVSKSDIKEAGGSFSRECSNCGEKMKADTFFERNVTYECPNCGKTC